MSNIYEFKIEDIETVRLERKNDKNHYHINYKRQYDKNGNDTLTFKKSFYSLPENDGKKTNVVCEHCGTLNKIPNNKYNDKSFIFNCGKCQNKADHIYDENKLIDILYSLMNKEKFDIYDIYINDTHII